MFVEHWRCRSFQRQNAYPLCFWIYATYLSTILRLRRVRWGLLRRIVSMIDSGSESRQIVPGLGVAVVRDAGTDLPALLKINPNNFWSRLNKTRP